MSGTRHSADVIGVYTSNFVQVFPRARAVKATVRPPAKLMEHPLETGTEIVDHRIILQIEIELSMILQAADYKNTYQQIRKYFLNGTLLYVQTKSAVYKNQIIAEMPHDEDPEMYDALAMGLKLKEVQFASTVFSFTPVNTVDTNTIQRGQQEGETPSPGNSRSGLSSLTGIGA